MDAWSEDLSEGERSMLTPDSPDTSEPQDVPEPYDPREPICPPVEPRLPPRYVRPGMEEGEVDKSRPSLSPDEARYVREVAAKLVKELYWPVRLWIWKGSAESLRAERERTSVGAIASCRVELSIDEAMALYSASCMRLAEVEEPTEEGVLEPLLDAGEDPPPTTLGYVDEALTASDVYAQAVLGIRRLRGPALSC
eukprot:64667-Pleurochrysis_carterae.AAC.1